MKGYELPKDLVVTLTTSWIVQPVVGAAPGLAMLEKPKAFLVWDGPASKYYWYKGFEGANGHYPIAKEKYEIDLKKRIEQ